MDDLLMTSRSLRIRKQFSADCARDVILLMDESLMAFQTRFGIKEFIADEADGVVVVVFLLGFTCPTMRFDYVIGAGVNRDVGREAAKAIALFVFKV